MNPSEYEAAEALHLSADRTFGDGWETLSTDPEDRREVDYSDVSDPEAAVVVGFGGDHRRVVFGASGE